MNSSQIYMQRVGDEHISDGEHDPSMPKAPRRTPMACQFCRGRKLKCDGRKPCGNCDRRTLPCSYVPVSAQDKHKHK